eukprot:g21217.t1
MDVLGSTLRRTGSSVAERSNKEMGALPTDSVMQFQLALRVELERQTKQLEDLLAKQAQANLQRNVEHRQAAGSRRKKKNQETCKRLEHAILRLSEAALDEEVKKSLDSFGEKIETQLSNLEKQSSRIESSMRPENPSFQLDLRERTLKLMRASEPLVTEEQTFADLQKQYGIRQREPVEAQPAKHWLAKICVAIVNHKRFEMDPQHAVFRGLDIAFNVCFTLELLIRWTSEGFLAFLNWHNPAFKWNWMDFGLVSLSLIEELAALLAAASFLDVSALRMLRMMRLVRVARIIRMLRFFSELRVMVNGIMGSAKPLLWAFVFLLILMFMVGVTFMQLAANYMSQERTMTLYMAISGGVDWKDCVAPLHVVSWAMEYMFATYVFFTLFCCLNIVTGIFVDNAKALKSADEDAMYLEALTERKRWIAEVKELFSRLDTSINGKFTLLVRRAVGTPTGRFQDFKTHVSSIKVQTLFRKLGINVDNIEADELWEILDADRSGEIDEERGLPQPGAGQVLGDRLASSGTADRSRSEVLERSKWKRLG